MAVASLIVAGRTSVPVLSIAKLVLLGYMGLGGSAAINSYFDRDIDVVMSRTAGRAVPSGRLSPSSALIFGFSILVISVSVSFVLINALTALIIGAGSLLYVGLYTVILKRRTPSSVLWGGLSGAIPALGGWAVYSHTDWLIPSLIFMVVFLWQPGHFWPLSIYYGDDYRAAGIPVISSLKDAVSISRSSLVYNALTIAVTYILFFVTRLSIIYLIVMSMANAYLLFRSMKALKSDDKRFFLGSFRFSIAYMFVFLLSLIAASLLNVPLPLL